MWQSVHRCGTLAPVSSRGVMKGNICACTFHVLERLFDQRHVAGDALVPCAVRLVMRVSEYAVRERANRGWPVAAEAKPLPFSRSIATLSLP